MTTSNERVVDYGSEEFNQLVKQGYKAAHFELVKMNPGYKYPSYCYLVLLVPNNPWLTGAWLQQRRPGVANQS